MLTGGNCFHLTAIRTRKVSCVSSVLSPEQCWPMSFSTPKQSRKRGHWPTQSVPLLCEGLPSSQQRCLRGQPPATTLSSRTLTAAAAFSRPQGDTLQGLGTGCKYHWTPSDISQPPEKKALWAVKTVTITASPAVSFVKYKSFVHHQRNCLNLKCYSLAKSLQECQLKKWSLMNINLEIM